MKLRLGLALWVTFGFWIAACAGSPPGSPTPPVDAAPTPVLAQDPLAMHLAGVEWEEPAAWKFKLVEDAHYVMAWRVLGGELKRNEYQELEVRFYRRGQPLDGLELEVLGWMPDHGHGFLRGAEVERLSSGSFRVSGVLFHMRGDWELTFDVAQAQRVDKLVFGVQL